MVDPKKKILPFDHIESGPMLQPRTLHNSRTSQEQAHWTVEIEMTRHLLNQENDRIHAWV